jgi:hypothetical protein
MAASAHKITLYSNGCHATSGFARYMTFLDCSIQLLNNITLLLRYSRLRTLDFPRMESTRQWKIIESYSVDR